MGCPAGRISGGVAAARTTARQYQYGLLIPYVLLDLGDWLETNLQDVHKALIQGTSMSGTAGALLEAFSTVYVVLGPLRRGARITRVHHPPPGPAAAHYLRAPGHRGQCRRAARHELRPCVVIVRAPAARGMAGGLHTVAGSLANLALLALQDAHVQPRVPSELSGMIKIDPAAPVPGHSPDTYIIRTVFEHDPCAPVLSAPSHPFQLARAMDGDAPARKIRIALPDISNMRQFKRGVAIEMPPSLRRLLDRVTPAMLQGKGLGPDPGVELGMICSFSIQIMWVLSFMVMFLFVISFNIIFWWVAFIKVCFPIPVAASKPENPSP